MMEALAPAFQVLLITGVAGEMLDELDLGVAGIGERELEILLRRAPAEGLVTSLKPEILDHIEARNSHSATEKLHPRRQVFDHERDLLKAAAEILKG